MKLKNVIPIIIVIILICLPSCSSHNKSSSFSVSYFFQTNTVLDVVAPFDIWVPIPESDEFQKITNVKIGSKFPHIITIEKEYGNKLAYIKAETDSISVGVTFDVVRSESAGYKALITPEMRKRLLTADKLGVVDDEIKAISAKIISGKKTTLEKARAIYDYVVGKMEYDKTTPGWGQGDTARACKVGKGNCSDFHTLFISLSRAAGIPACFIYGFAIPKDSSGNAIPHCWAEFYDDESGKWTPVDCSEAKKHPELRDYYFGKLDANRVAFTRGRDITLEPKQSGVALNFLINPYIEIIGKEISPTKVEYTFSR